MLRVAGLRVEYGDTVALDGIDFDLGGSEVIAVLGPSGCGKTTLLRVIAGLEPRHEGRVRWGPTDITGVSVHKRRFGLVFQSYALFPHRTVARNVSFGLEVGSRTPSEVTELTAAALAMVGLSGLAERRIAELSGGEQQRVALARALAPRPRLLMFDEPLAALDRELRARLLDDLISLLRTTGVPALYVTHDQEEALALGHRVAVMRRGRIVQLAPPEEVWHRPADGFVARFVGFTNITPYSIDAGKVHSAWGVFAAPAGAPTAGILAARPEAFVPDRHGPVRGRVVESAFRGGRYDVVLRLESGTEVRALWTHRPPSPTVVCSVDVTGAVFLPPSALSQDAAAEAAGDS